jgi:hypothetical protein
MPQTSDSRLAALLARAEILSMPVAAITGIHIDVPALCINTYPTREDDLLRYTEAAVGMLLLQHPIGVVASGKAGKFSVVTGLDAWRALSTHKLQSKAVTPRGRRPKVPQRSLFDTLRVVAYSAPCTKEDVELLAHADLWLKLAALYPDSQISDATLVRAHDLAGKSLLHELTPDIASLRALAGFLGHRSHAGLYRYRRTVRPTPTSEPEPSTETLDDRSDSAP